MNSNKNFSFMPTKLFLLALSIFSFLGFNVNGQVFGGPGNDVGYQIIHTNDGGYIICGDYQNSTSEIDIYLIKLNSCGDQLWTKTLGDTLLNDHANSIAQTPDGGYIIMGTFDNDYGAGTPIAWLLRLDSAGDSLWTRKYNRGQWADWGISAYVRSNGNYVLGMITDDITMDNPFTVFETDTLGNELWSTIVNGSTHFYGYASQVFQGRDNSTLTASSYTVGPFNLIVSKLDSAGNIEFIKSYEDTSANFLTFNGNGICETNDSSYMVVGSSDYFSSGNSLDFFYMKINSLGDSLWSRSFGGSGTDELVGIRSLVDGGFIAAGNTSSFGNGGNDAMLIRFDQQGDTLWTKTYGGPDNEWVRYLEVNSDGGFVMIGDTTNGMNGTDVWVVITDSLGNILPGCSTLPCFLAYYPFNGDAIDSTGNGNDGFVNGATLTMDRFGNINSAYDFNGINNFIEVSDSPSLQFSNNEQSICFWMKIPSIPQPQNQVGVIEKMDQHLLTDPTGESAQGFSININVFGSIVYATKSGVGSLWAQAEIDSNQLFINQSMFVCFTNDGDSIRSYLDGNKIETQPVPSGTVIGQNNVSLLIGKDRWTSNGDSMDYYLGVLDDIRFYGCALSDSEITNLLNTFPLSIDDNFDSNSLVVYPNPASGKVQIQYSVPLRSDVTLEVFNSFGQNVYNLKTKKEEGENSIYLDTKDFDCSGVYLVKLSIGNVIQIRRLIVLD